ncbi:MAG: hypothetical protein WD601_09235 [Pseudohongiellaceae bacterium]
MQRSVIVILLTILTVACKEQDVKPDVPALITNPGPATLQEVERTLSGALNGMRIMLAADALTDQSVVVIQRNPKRSLDRPPELGRDLGRPYHFQLVTNGMHCALINLQNGERWPLTDVECAEE